jgi:hypothetical protein
MFASVMISQTSHGKLGILPLLPHSGRPYFHSSVWSIDGSDQIWASNLIYLIAAGQRSDLSDIYLDDLDCSIQNLHDHEDRQEKDQEHKVQRYQRFMSV